MPVGRLGMIIAAIVAATAPAMASSNPPPEQVIDLRTVEGAGQTLDASIAGHPGTFMVDSGWGFPL